MYLNSFPCKYTCQHNNVLKLTILSTTRFDRSIILKFNTTLANLTSDIRASFQLSSVTASSSQQNSLQSYNYSRNSLIFKHNLTAHSITHNLRTAIKISLTLLILMMSYLLKDDIKSKLSLITLILIGLLHRFSLAPISMKGRLSPLTNTLLLSLFAQNYSWMNYHFLTS